MSKLRNEIYFTAACIGSEHETPFDKTKLTTLLEVAAYTLSPEDLAVLILAAMQTQDGDTLQDAKNRLSHWSAVMSSDS